MKRVILSGLCALALAGCPRNRGAESNASSNATDAAQDAAPREQPAARAPSTRRITGTFPGTDAIIAIRENPAIIAVQRREGSVFERLSTFECTSPPPAEGERARTSCQWLGAQCTGSMHMEDAAVIGGSPRLVVTSAPINGGTTEGCAKLAGTFFLPSYARGPRGPSFPALPEHECMLDTWTFSPDQRTCAAAAGDGPVKSFAGACCVGAPIAQFASTAPARLRWISDDGRSLAMATDSDTLSLDQQRSNAVFLRVLHGSDVRELRVNDVFAGDPVLAGGTSFSFDVSLNNRQLDVRSVGGTTHSITLAR